ncbi:dynein regulatory complex subunit 6-like [Pieris napi]|uniref:dynein regulatory complex subunit 6-like n=1 Tax=Pieris napi TaxID=78633 RepID=UPI001FB97AE0|nr:dynein regulatory complex subunit 6-like [Pieris napi]
MYFENDFEIEVFNHSHLFQVLSGGVCDIASRYDNVRSVPTHTEDGIPIRKLYVSNLPAKTTRSELFGIFAPYGFIKSCWLRMGDRGPNRSPTPTYAFVTFSNPADAHKALLAPFHEKQLRGYNLRISPADSWHQPVEDSEGRVHWKPLGERTDARLCPNDLDQHPGSEVSIAGSSANHDGETNSQKSEEDDDSDSYNILNILNQDCMSHILSYVPVLDLIRSERVSKRWRNMINEHLQGIRTFKTSWWRATGIRLTTAVLRRLLQRLGGSLHHLHIDHSWSALNDRTAHTVGKYCPNLESLKVVSMNTKNWNPLIYGCKELTELTFVSCHKLTDSSLVHAVKPESKVEKISVANNSHVTGLFLNITQPSKLTSLSFYNCYSLQGPVLCVALNILPNLTTLKLDLCPIYVWKVIPLILNKLPQLEELSLREYMTVGECVMQVSTDEFCSSFATLKNLKRLHLSNNIYVSNSVLKQVGQTCHELEYLNISNCNSKLNCVQPGAGDEGVIAICSSCPSLTYLDVSYLAGLSHTGLRSIVKLKSLQTLICRGNPVVTTTPFIDIVESCYYLEELDLCGCNNVTEEIIPPLIKSVEAHPRKIVTRLAGTAAYLENEENLEDSENPILPAWHNRRDTLNIDFKDDRCDPRLRPDFTDDVYDNRSDGSFEYGFEQDVYENIIAEMFSSDDEMFLDDDLDYEAIDDDLFDNGFFVIPNCHENNI